MESTNPPSAKGAMLLSADATSSEDKSSSVSRIKVMSEDGSATLSRTAPTAASLEFPPELWKPPDERLATKTRLPPESSAMNWMNESVEVTVSGTSPIPNPPVLIISRVALSGI